MLYQGVEPWLCRLITTYLEGCDPRLERVAPMKHVVAFDQRSGTGPLAAVALDEPAAQCGQALAECLRGDDVNVEVEGGDISCGPVEIVRAEDQSARVFLLGDQESGRSGNSLAHQVGGAVHAYLYAVHSRSGGCPLPCGQAVPFGRRRSRRSWPPSTLAGAAAPTNASVSRMSPPPARGIQIRGRLLSAAVTVLRVHGLDRPDALVEIDASAEVPAP